MITHAKKKTVQGSTLKIRSITHRVEKSHRQVNYLDKFSQNSWFSSHTLKFLGKSIPFFHETAGTGPF